jgi:hypothetical protein
MNLLMVLAQSLNAVSKERAKRHPSYFVREIHKGSSWKSPKRNSHPQLLYRSHLKTKILN